MPTLHYLYDPLCGWCYAAAPLLDAILERHPALPLTLHAGGLFQHQAITRELGQHIREHDAHISQLSGQPFGKNYLHELLNDPATVFDSPRVIPAILAMESLDHRAGLPMLKAIQSAHYVEGLKVVNQDVLAQLAQRLHQPPQTFLAAYAAALGARTQAHIAATRRLMAQVGAQGFPGFVIEKDGQMQLADHMAYYGQPQEFVAAVEQLLG
jgi:putative protein-disulfide isomerase